MANNPIRMLIVFCALLIFRCSSAMEAIKVGQTSELQRIQERCTLLRAAATKYLDFLNGFGRGEKTDRIFTVMSDMNKIFAPTVLKSGNTEVLSRGDWGLFDQLTRIREKLVAWHAFEENICIDHNNNTVAVCYRIPINFSETNVIHVMKFLKCDEQGLITEIKEFFFEKK